jgi:hypothetical protein
MHHDWRSEFLKLCGPGLLCGITAPLWRRLLKERGTSVELSRLPRVLSVTMQSLKNSYWGGVERRRFDPLVSKVILQPPVFILGHWRSGTTHLHELMARDERFGWPNSYQTSFPFTFLSTEKSTKRWLSKFIPRCRPMDNMELTLSTPQEDEFALCAMTLKSPCVGWVFPRQRWDFEKYLTLESVSAGELSEWRNALTWFLKKVQFLSQRPLLLKSPPHTARIRRLLEMFPEAKFIHIHRDPYRVIQSTIHTLRILNRWHGLQSLGGIDLEDWVVSQYATMYRAYFNQVGSLRPGQHYEICYERLVSNPVGEMRSLYQAMGFQGFEKFRPALEVYLASVADYKKNRLEELPARLRERIAAECRDCFEHWGYTP